MIKPADLKINNWILPKGIGMIPSRVSALKENAVYIKLNGIHEKVDADGILLSKEILRKAGFKSYEFGSTFRLYSFIGYVDKASGKVLIDFITKFNLVEIRTWLHTIEYLHDLQNTCKHMVGQELEINLLES